MSVYNIQSFSLNQDQSFIFDTNILIKIFYPLMSDSPSPYVDFYASIQKCKAKLLISSIQVSEFINRCIRFQYELWTGYRKSQNLPCAFKKDYRDTDDYKESMQAILEIVSNDILQYSECIDDKFSEIDSDKLYIYGFSYDFNDAIIAEIARKYNATVVTDDIDFANYSSRTNIATLNKALLLFR